MGIIKLSTNDKQVEYHKWSLEEDVSHVAFLEIPYSRLVEIRSNSQEEQFLPTEDDRINVSNIHLPMMQLAEIYLAYTAAISPINSPDVIMMDNSISTMLGHVDIPIEKQTTVTRLNALYSDWKTKNDLIEGRFKKQEETINKAGGTYGKNW